jgi:peptidoglycan/xylan/chitin deacetylase (PgdA/CDA1 family)
VSAITPQHRSFRRLLKDAYVTFLHRAGLLRWARSRAARSGIVVLTFHRVLHDAEYDSTVAEPGMLTRADTFEALLQYLRGQCQWISVADGMPDNGESSCPRVAITFDDGWKDNLDVALPLVQRYSGSFTVFLCPELLSSGKIFWTEAVANLWRDSRVARQSATMENIWQRCFDTTCPADSLHTLIAKLKQLPQPQRDHFISELTIALAPHSSEMPGSRQLLNWQEIGEMAQSGISFGSHTDTHQILTAVSEPVAEQELSSSRNAIAEKLQECSLFAYPNGDWSERVRMIVGRCGYQKAFVNQPGIWKSETNLLSIPRVNLWEGNLTDFQGRFSIAQAEYCIFWKALRSSPPNQ